MDLMISWKMLIFWLNRLEKGLLKKLLARFGASLMSKSCSADASTLMDYVTIISDELKRGLYE